MAAGGVAAPFQFRLEAVEEVRSAGEDLTEALRYGLDQIRVLSHGVLAAVGAGTQVRGRALLVALSPGTVLVVGVSSLAHAVRELFESAGGFTGWQLAQLPATCTPLHHLKPHLLTRQYNVLARRYEFATVEEVATVPAEVWPDMAGVGPHLLQTLTQALPSVLPQQPQPEGEYSSPALSSTGEHGWRLQVSADGTRATVQAPNTVALMALSGATVQLAQTTNAGNPPEAADDDLGEDELVWSTELAERILRRAQPTGSTFLRALIDEGGTATAERLRERTGLSLHHATQTLTTAAAAVLSGHHPDGRRWRRFVSARTHPDQPRGRVYDYQLPEHLVPIFAEALQRLGR